MVVTIRTIVEFEAAHRQLGDASKCGRLHGHNWVVDFAISGNVPEGSVGYLVDFKDLKTLVEPYDHTTMLVAHDPLVPILEGAGQSVCRLPLNPTCENMAAIICRRVVEAQFPGVEFVNVTVWENQKSSASVSLPEIGD